jgi:hypothetical protein
MPPRRGAHNALFVLRIGITILAALGGAVAYLGLLDLGLNPIVAALLALGFALLSRQAASSLILDALVRRAASSLILDALVRRARSARTGSHGPGAATAAPDRGNLDRP